MVYEVAPTLDSEDKILKCDHSNENYSTEEFFFVILFIMLYKVVWMNSSRVTIKMKATKKNIQVLK